jgi:hypothetical protein
MDGPNLRNPWNEYECGSYYARAMASYALLGALSGFRYSAVAQTLWFGPKRNRRPFVTFFSSDSAYGTIALNQRTLTVTPIEGRLSIRRVILNLGKKVLDLAVEETARVGRPAIILFPAAQPAKKKKSKRNPPRS